MWKRRMKKEKFKDMVREELQALLNEHGLTEDYTLQLLEETIRKAKDKGDITNLMRAVDNLQDMHGMKEKHLLKTTEQIEATSNTKLIDELTETEEKLIATKTTITED
jgi:NADH:ubiquinone oxidoreductase subunit E